MKARIQDGVVVEILQPLSGFTIEQCFHPDVLTQCVDFVAGMEVGQPAPMTAPTPEPITEPINRPIPEIIE